MSVDEFGSNAAANKLAILKFVEKQINLNPRPHGEVEVGLPYFPSPDRIDEAIEPVYVEVRAPKSRAGVICRRYRKGTLPIAPGEGFANLRQRIFCMPHRSACYLIRGLKSVFLNL